MNATFRRPNRSGFTLMEMLAVITIIIILAALVVGGMGYVNQRQSREKAKVQISLLSNALEEYKLDFGIYPPGGSSTDLYQALFYEGYDYNQSGSPSNWTKTVDGKTISKSKKIYLPDLDASSDRQGWVTKSTTVPASTTIKDPWGNDYNYRRGDHGSAINPDFDLWSYGPDGKGTSAAEKTDDITNY